MRVFAFFIAIGLALGADDLRAEPDNVSDIGSRAAARLVTESVLTEEYYDHFIQGLVSDGVFDEYAEDKSVRKAAKESKEMTFEAFVAGLKVAMPRKAMIEGLSVAVEKQFNFEELKQILKFVRSDVGKRYMGLTANAEYKEAFFSSLEKSGVGENTASALNKEFSARFPKIKFDLQD